MCSEKYSTCTNKLLTKYHWLNVLSHFLIHKQFTRTTFTQNQTLNRQARYVLFTEC